jgi:hypothetical protein
VPGPAWERERAAILERLGVVSLPPIPIGGPGDDATAVGAAAIEAAGADPS